MMMDETGNKRQGAWKGSFLSWFFWYSLLFAAMAAVVFLPFKLTGKSLCWSPDGLAEHFPDLVIVHKTLREGLHALLTGEDWKFPLYFFSNAIAPMNLQYNPLQLLAVFWPWEDLDSYYSIHLIAYFYLTGLTFMVMCRFFRRPLLPALTGAMNYAFCGMALYGGTRHPFFLWPMIMLPLLIVGVEKVLRRERSWVLTISVFLSMTGTFGVYFSCMQAILVCLYVLVRFPDYCRQDRPREFLRLWGRLAVWGGMGILLSCFTALPTLLQILSGNRMGVDIWSYTDPFRYNTDYYQQFMVRFTMTPTFQHWMVMGFSALCVPAVLLLYYRRDKEARSLRILFVVLTCMHMIPAVGYVMSGFSNVNNRFCFAYALCVSFILTLMLSRMEELSVKDAVMLTGLTGAYFVIAWIFPYNRYNFTKLIFAAIALSLGAVLLFRFGGKLLRKFLKAAYLITVCVSIIFSAVYFFGNGEPGDYTAEFYDGIGSEIEKSQYASLAKSDPVREDTSFFRVAGDIYRETDSGLTYLFDLNGMTSFPYYSASMDYLSWIREMEMPRMRYSIIYNFAVRQPEMLALTDIKYYASRDSDQADWPYGFKEIDRVESPEGTDTILYNENWLPLGYTYDSYILREDYEDLDPLAKRAAQMQSVVLDGDVPLQKETADTLNITARQIPYTAEGEMIEWGDGKLQVKENQADLTLTFAGLPGSETYVRIVGMDLTRCTGSSNWTLTASTQETSVSGNWRTDNYVYANLQHSQLLDIGYSQEGLTSVTLTFPKKGVFKLEDIQIWCQPMEEFPAQTAALRAEPLENIHTDGRGLTGTVDMSREKFLCVALPWLDGWRAYVDGEETPLYHANTGFMGLMVPAGEHTVELRYWMPGLTAGIALTCVGAAGCLLLLWSGRRKSRLQRREKA